MNTPLMPKVWYVAIVGRPNAGKSTLINALIGEKVSSVSHRPQTTQRTIPGIYTDEERWLQIIFLDTPGIHHDGTEQYGSQKSKSMNTRINSEAFAGLRDADVILRLVDPTRVQWAEDARIDEALSFSKVPVLRIETKQDLAKHYPGKDIDIHVDSVTGEGFETLIDAIAERLPEWPYLYDEDMYTDQSMDLRIQEVIREVLFQELGDEIPYACYVEVGSIEEAEHPRAGAASNLMKIQAYIITESDSQKVIVIGKWWKKIEKIGTESRFILEHIFGKKIFLALRVKVDKNWRKNEKTLERLFPKR